MRRSLLFVLLLFPSLFVAQSDSISSDTAFQPTMKLSFGLQLWATYTTGMEVFDGDTDQYQAVDNRWNFQLRRGRFTLDLNPYPRVFAKVTAASDLVGKDLLAATEAAGNNGSSPQFRLWNALLQWRVFPDADIHLTGGYMPIPLGRESQTGTWGSPSFEKAFSMNYLRRHLTGFGPGRAIGLQLGGFNPVAGGDWLHLSYNIAVMNPVFAALNANSTGTQDALLYIGRVTWQFGDPEFSHYRRGLTHNFFGKRRGLSIGIGGASQGSTDGFRYNRALSVDFLLNWDQLNLDGDWSILYRADDRESIRSSTGYLRASYNINVGNKEQVLEPALTFWTMRGPTEAAAAERLTALRTFGGIDETWEAGLNFYVKPKVKFSLHYTWRSGRAGALSPTEIINNYFQQSRLGPIQRGDFLGMGLTFTY